MTRSQLSHSEIELTQQEADRLDELLRTGSARPNLRRFERRIAQLRAMCDDPPDPDSDIVAEPDPIESAQANAAEATTTEAETV